MVANMIPVFAAAAAPSAVRTSPYYAFGTAPLHGVFKLSRGKTAHCMENLGYNVKVSLKLYISVIFVDISIPVLLYSAVWINVICLFLGASESRSIPQA